MTRAHYMNGRVLLRPMGGVYRFAEEVSTRLPDCTIISPRSAKYPTSARIWEQTKLGRDTADGVLLSTAHGGPLRHPRHVVVVHDLLAITMPSSVNRSFSALQRLQLPRLIRRAAAVATVSRQVADEVLANFNISGDRVHVVPPGISDVFRPDDRERSKSELGLDPARPVVAALLDPTPRKNSATVAQMLTKLKDDRPDIQLVVAGASAPAPFARSRSTKVATRPDEARDLGAATDAQLAAMYKAADVFVALSSAEGFGLPVVEAARSGAAVVTTPMPSILEYGQGAAVIVNDLAAAETAVFALLDSPERRAELGARAADQLADLLWANTAASLDDLMASVGG